MRVARTSPRRALILGAAVLLLSLPTTGAGAVDDQPQIGFASGETWVSSEPNLVDLYIANADGSGLVNLTAGYGAEWPWAWSPDASRIAFFSHDGGAVNLYVRSLDETEPFTVADGPDPDEGMAWSPDGTRIVFTSLQDGNNEIYVADVDVRSARNVSNDPWESSRPRWSPTGSHLAYDVRRDVGGETIDDVYIVRSSGGEAVSVTDDMARSSGGAWSPDGSHFVFVTNRDGDDDIYVADGDGLNPVRLTDSPANDGDPAWSPDGSKIAFSSGLATRNDDLGWLIAIPSRIYVMDADGSNRHAVTDGSIDPDPNPSVSISHTGPTWSADGSRLAIAVTTAWPSAHGRSFTVYVVNPTTIGSAVKVWSGGGGWSLTWSPDGTWMSISSTGTYPMWSDTVIADTDGTGTPVRVTGGVGSGPAGWSTYGTHFAYMNGGGAGPGDTVFVTAPDGTNPVSVTEGLPAPFNSAAAWRPQPLGPVGLVDPSSGLWRLRDEWGWIESFYYGNPGDYPFVGDWDGNGIDTPGLYRQSDGYVYLRNSNTQGNADVRFFFGNPGDVPLAGDFNGDGCDTVSIYRPSEQRFYVINELGDNDGGLGTADYDFLFGNPGDQPVVGDWDGDGIEEIGLHRASTGFFYYRNTLTTGVADGEFYFGDPGDRFVAGDWGTVDGRDTPAVFRPSNTVFYFRHTLTEGNADSQFTWPAGETDWLPVAGDFGE